MRDRFDLWLLRKFLYLHNRFLDVEEQFEPLSKYSTDELVAELLERQKDAPLSGNVLILPCGETEHEDLVW